MLRPILTKLPLNRHVTISSAHTSALSLTKTRRSFFWNGDDNDNGNGNKGGKSSKSNKIKGTKNSKETNNNDSSSDSDNTSSNSSSSSSASGSYIMPARLGFGDEAPRYPHLTALPIINRPLFPGIVTSVTITDEATIRQLEKLGGNSTGTTGGYVGVFLRNPQYHGSNNASISASANIHSHTSDSGLILEQPELITDPKELYNVGTFAQIHRFSRVLDHQNPSSGTIYNINDDDEVIQDDGSGTTASRSSSNSSSNPASILLLAHRRIDLLSVDSIGPPIDATVSHWEKLAYKVGADSSLDDTIKALSNEILKAIRELAQNNPLFRENVTFYPMKVDANDPYRLADFAASLTTGTAADLQAVLEEKDAEMRLHKALVLLSKERELSKLQQEISRKVEEKMTEQQRKYMLHEQLKSIKKELGMEKDDKEALLAKYRKKISEFGQQPEQEVMDTIEAELEKLSTLEKNSSEFNVTRSYLGR